MKAAMNGVLNFSVLDGWWMEGFNAENGFAIGGIDVTDDAVMDKEDAESLYVTLEQQVIPTYYSHGGDGLPSPWIKMMKKAIATLTPKFSSDRMVRENLNKIYQI